jgi:hypothetical protein
VPDVIDFHKAAEEFNEFSKPPFSTAKAKPRKKPHAWEIPPAIQASAAFPPDVAAILKQAKITKKQFGRYVETLAIETIRRCGADFVAAMQKGIRLGDSKQIELFAKMAGLVKNDGLTINNITGQNTIVSVTNNRHFDSIVRSLDDRDRHSRVEPLPIVIDAVPELENGHMAQG